MSKIYKIFISHSWEYSDSYNRLCQMLDNKACFSYKNHSVPKDDPVHTNGTDKQLRNAITNKMKGCHVVLIMAGKYSTYSKWIKEEINIAKEEFNNPKPIVGIKPWASKIVSSVVLENSNEVVEWNTDTIVQAIREYAI